MSDALAQLKERLRKTTDLERISRVLSWDHQTMMPPAGSEHRAEHLATLRRISHEILIDDETGRLLDELRPLEESLEPDSDDGALLRLVRRDYEKAVRVPTELRAEMTRAAARARPVWVKARAESDFQQFLPALERNIEFGRKHRVNGTPGLFFEDGTRKPGALPGAEVEELLVAAAANARKN